MPLSAPDLCILASSAQKGRGCYPKTIQKNQRTTGHLLLKEPWMKIAQTLRTQEGVVQLKPEALQHTLFASPCGNCPGRSHGSCPGFLSQRCLGSMLALSDLKGIPPKACGLTSQCSAKGPEVVVGMLLFLFFFFSQFPMKWVGLPIRSFAT